MSWKIQAHIQEQAVLVGEKGATKLSAHIFHLAAQTLHHCLKGLYDAISRRISGPNCFSIATRLFASPIFDPGGGTKFKVDWIID